MKNNQVEILIAKHLSGETTKKELNEFKLWLNSNSRNREEFNKIALTYQLSQGTTNTERKSIVFDDLNRRIEAARKIGLKRNHSISTLKIRWSIAASIIFFIAVGIIFYTNNTEKNPVESKITIVEKTNPAGQKSKIFLPDGSIAWLNSESSLSYKSDFNDSIRYVEMSGEAYFEVKKDKSRPFIVKSKDLTTTVLGTAFNINAFSEDDGVLIALTSGKISVENIGTELDHSPLIIYPGEGVLYKPSESKEMLKISIDIEGVKRWKDGVLELQEATLNETIDLLSRWYGVEFELKNSPNRNWNATGIFDNEYLENVLSTLSFSQSFEYKINGNQISITFTKTNSL